MSSLLELLTKADGGKDRAHKIEARHVDLRILQQCH